jgi:hypothetical protein
VDSTVGRETFTVALGDDRYELRQGGRAPARAR